VFSTHSARLQAAAEREHGDRVQPQLRQADGLPDRGQVGGTGRAVALGGGDGLPGHVAGQVPVHRAALVREHLAQSLEGGSQVGRVGGAEQRGERVVRVAAGAASPGVLALGIVVRWQSETERDIVHSATSGRMGSVHDHTRT
jgi:hypothetical protein